MKYQIMEQKAGQSARSLDLVPIWADTDAEAEAEFTQWALNWLKNRDSQEAEDLFLELSVRDVDSISYDSTSYYLEAEAPADQAFKVLLDPGDGHSYSIEICIDCYAERGEK